MFIYSSTKVLPYVYMCTEKETGNFYIGYRYANKVPSTEDFGTNYFSSNEYVNQNFDKFEHHIVAEFFDRVAAYKFETKLIAETCSDKQINTFKKRKVIGTKYKEKVPFIAENKICALPGCNNIVADWRVKCCCILHRKQYAGMKRHGKF